jgi:glycosyltransferase involved in cell wall biosynthesis
VEPRDASGLAQALAHLIQNPIIRTKMGAAGRIIAENEFSLEQILPQTLAVYKSSISNDGREKTI